MKTTVRALRRALPILAVLALGACGDSPTFPPEFDASLGVDLSTMTKTDSGLYYKDLVVGTGETVAVGTHANIRYTGWLADGNQFDTGTFDATVGTTSLIPGFTEGLIGMQAGGKRKLVIRPELGYGKKDYGPIPGNSTLVFDVEILEILQ